jgi:hypothetical protein
MQKEQNEMFMSFVDEETNKVHMDRSMLWCYGMDVLSP